MVSHFNYTAYPYYSGKDTDYFLYHFPFLLLAKNIYFCWPLQNQIWVVVEKEGSFSRPFCVVPAKKSTTSTCVVADAADSGLKLDLVALDALCKAQASAMKMSTTRPLRDLEAITGLPIYIQRGCERIDQYFLRIIPRNDCNVVTIEHSPNASRLCSLKLASVASLRYGTYMNKHSKELHKTHFFS